MLQPLEASQFVVLGEAPSRWIREQHFRVADSAQHPSIPAACGPWHDGAGHFLTLYICNDYWSLLDPLRDLPYPPSGMPSNLHKALCGYFCARNPPIPYLPQYKQFPRIAVKNDAPRPAWLCGTFAMCATLHLLLGDRRSHELSSLHITITRMLAFHQALLEWPLVSTPPALWHIGCLHQDIHPHTRPIPAPTLCSA